MREFYLYINGVTYDLNGGRYLFTSPTGLGVAFSNTIADLGDGFSVTTKRGQKLGQVVGKLVFFKDGNRTPYDVYNQFVNNATAYSDKIVLGYKPSNGLYMANVELTYLTKTESNDNQFIEIPVAFDLKSLWYTKETKSLSGGTASFASVGITTGFEVSIPTHSKDIVISTRESGATSNVQEVSLDFTSTTESRPFVYSNVPNDSKIIAGLNVLGSVPADLTPYITSLEHPEKIYGRPTAPFSVSAFTSGGTALTGTVTCYKYWRTV